MATLSVALRYPGNHEIGVDSFFIHTLAQSIIGMGHAAWTPNPLAYFGWYPVSYPSGGPFLLAAISSVAGTSVEASILGSSMLLGLLGMLSAFVMAREFRPSPGFATGVAFLYGMAPRFLAFTLWQASTRNLFMAILPMFIWSLMRFHRTRSLLDLSICVSIVVLLASAHRLVVLVLLLVIAYIFAVIILGSYRLLRRTRPYLVMRSSRIGLTRWAALLGTFAAGAGFLFGTQLLTEYSVGELASGTSVPIELLNLGVSITRSVGLAAPLALVGLIYSPWAKNGGIRELFCVTALIALVPTLFLRLYTGFYVLPFLAIIAVYGLQALAGRLKNRKRAIGAAIVLATLAVPLFSGAVLRYEQSVNPPMTLATYNVGLYLSASGQDQTLICNEQNICSQIAAVGAVPIVPTAGGTPDDPSPEMLVFGFYRPGEVSQHLVRIPLQDITVNSDSPWTVVGLDPNNDYGNLIQSFFGQVSSRLSARYHPAYYLEVAPGAGSFFDSSGVAYPSALAVSVYSRAYSIYADGSVGIWWIWTPNTVVPGGS